MIRLLCGIFLCCTAALRCEILEEALGTLAASVEQLAWDISPITCIKSWTIADIDINPYAPIQLSELTPQTESFSNLIVRPYEHGINTYIVTVSKQTGTLCGYHAIKNILWLLSAIMSPTPHDAREWLRKMNTESLYKGFQNRMGKKCAASDNDIDNFLRELSHGTVGFQETLASQAVLAALKNDHSFIRSINLNNSRTSPESPFRSIGNKNCFIEAVKEFQGKSTPAFFPAILLATESPNPNAASAHFVAILGINDGVRTALFLCDSLARGQAYGIPSYMELISKALFAKTE